MSNEKDLNKLAEEELLREAQRGAMRAATGGALAWKKCPLPPTNKQFLFNVIHNIVIANKIKDEHCKNKEKISTVPSDSESKRKKRRSIVE